MLALPGSKILCMEKLPNGNLVVGTFDGKVLVIDTEGRSEPMLLTEHRNASGGVTCLSVVEYRGQVYVFSGGGCIVQANHLGGNENTPQTVTCHSHEVQCLTTLVFRDKVCAFSGGCDDVVREGHLGAEPDWGRAVTRHEHWVECVTALAHHGKIYVFSSGDDCVRESFAGGHLESARVLTCNRGGTNCLVALADEGKVQVLSGGKDGVRENHAGGDASTARILTPHEDPVTCLAALRHRGKIHVFSGGGDNCVRENYAEGNESTGRVLTRHDDVVSCLTALVHDGQLYCFSGGSAKDKCVRGNRSGENENSARVLTRHEQEVWCVAALAQGNKVQVFSGGKDQGLHESRFEIEQTMVESDEAERSDPFWITGKDLERYFSLEDSLLEFSRLFKHEEKNDLALAIVGGAFLDTLLEHILASFLVDDPNEVEKLLRFDQPLGTYGHRTRTAYCLGLISKTIRDDLRAIGKVRNRFAHDLSASFDDPQIKSWCEALKWHRTAYMQPPQDASGRDLFYVGLKQLVAHLNGIVSIARSEKRISRREN